MREPARQFPGRRYRRECGLSHDAQFRIEFILLGRLQATKLCLLRIIELGIAHDFGLALGCAYTLIFVFHTPTLEPLELVLTLALFALALVLG